MQLEKLIKRLTLDHKMQSFDCGHKDLNDFCINDSYAYLRQLLAVTYYIENRTDTVLFFSLSNDKISATETSKSFWRKLRSRFPHDKHRKDYPAVKIGRFGVNRKLQKSDMHWGTLALEFIKHWMITDNKTGCRFITVDAYKDAVPFYLKNDFLFMGSEEASRYRAEAEKESDGTYAMYFDLFTLLE